MLQTYLETWVHQKRRMRRTWMCWTARTMPRDYRRRWWMTTCHDNKPWMTLNRMTTWPWMLSHLAARTSWNHRAVSLYYYTSHELMYQQTAWNDVRFLTKKTRNLHYPITYNVIWANQKTDFFFVSLVTRTCNVWRKELSPPFCLASDVILSSVDTLIINYIIVNWDVIG